MTHIARTSWRIFMGGMAAGFIGVVVFAGGRASADPAFPAPPIPVPGAAAAPAQAPAPPVQNLTALPGGGRYTPTITPPLTLTPAPAPASAPFPPSAPAAMPAMPPTVTAPVTSNLRDYLKSKGVKLEAQRPQTLKALEIILPVPTRWTQVLDPNVPDAFAVIADRVGGNSVYTSNAQVVVYKLVGDFDTAEAITHGYADSQQLLAWQTTNASLANVNGFASAKIEGTYRENDMTLNTSRRQIIVTSGPDRYLVSLSVTTAAAQAVTDAPATDAIINGFRVKVPGAPAPAPPAPAASAVPAPVAAAVPAPAVAVPAPAAVAVPAPAAVAVPAPAAVAPAPAATAPKPAATAPKPAATAPAPVAAAPAPAAPLPAAPARAVAAAPAPVVGLPGQAAVPNQLPAAPVGAPAPNLLTMIPGLPPLPNLNLTSVLGR
jgi:hypothetical protein